MRDLVDRISTAPRLAYHGHGYRQLAPLYDPLSGEGARINGGRFNASGSFPVLYLCSTAGCAAAEFIRFASKHPLGPAGFLPRSLYRYDVSLTSVLNLTDPQTLEHLDMTLEMVVDEDWSLTQQIGEVAHQFGYQAILNASATGVDEVLAVLVENIRTGTVGPIPVGAWQSLDDLPVF
jgi:RES domain-containing protein